MNKWWMALALVAGLAGLADAQQGGDRPGRGRFGPGRQMDRAAFVGPLVVPLADADRNAEVTAKEWKGFLEGLGPQGESVPAKPLKMKLLAGALDRDKDGKVELADLDAGFQSLDRNGDGSLQEEELRGRRRGGGRRGGGGFGGGRDGGNASSVQPPDGGSGQEPGQPPRRRRPGARRGMGIEFVQRSLASGLARAADGDRSGDVSAGEWKKFTSTIVSGTGAIDVEKVGKLLGGSRGDARRGGDGAPRGRRNFGVLRRLDRMLGVENGKISRKDLQSAFERMDRNKDGKVDAKEMAGPPRRGMPV